MTWHTQTVRMCWQACSYSTVSTAGHSLTSLAGGLCLASCIFDSVIVAGRMSQVPLALQALLVYSDMRLACPAGVPY